MPSTSKTNKLITDIAEVLDIEIASQTKDDSTFDVSNLAHYQLEQGNPINLKNDGSGDLHVVQYGLTINMDKTASDYSKVSANIEASTSDDLRYGEKHHWKLYIYRSDWRRDNHEQDQRGIVETAQGNI